MLKQQSLNSPNKKGDLTSIREPLSSVYVHVIMIANRTLTMDLRKTYLPWSGNVSIAIF